MSDVRVRFAPSPTGFLHIGSARTALFNWLFARHFDGSFLIRVEDTDIERSEDKYTTLIFEGLSWLGIKADEEPVVQHDNQSDHRLAAFKLLEAGRAYPCFCEKRAEKYDENHVGYLPYDRACRDKAYSQNDLSRPHVIRYKAPLEGTISFEDLIRGQITFDLSLIDDFVLLRQDGSATYNLAVVVDDIAMKISHVIRGEDHIANTPKQILIYQALKGAIPFFAHLPMILNESGGKLSKRDGVVGVEAYKEQGVLAKAFVNYLARLGWSCGDQEIFTESELIEKFTLKSVNRAGAQFDNRKLAWFNAHYMANTSSEQLIEMIEELDSDKHEQMLTAWTDKIVLLDLITLYKQRSRNLIELSDDVVSLSYKPTVLDCSLISPYLKPFTIVLLQKFVEFYETSSGDLVELKAFVKSILKEYSAKFPDIGRFVRFGLTGVVEGPGMYDLLLFLPKEEAVERIKLLLSKLS